MLGINKMESKASDSIKYQNNVCFSADKQIENFIQMMEILNALVNTDYKEIFLKISWYK